MATEGVLKPGGVIVWVVADATKDGSETGTKHGTGAALQNGWGLNLHDTMIYAKTSGSQNGKPI